MYISRSLLRAPLLGFCSILSTKHALCDDSSTDQAELLELMTCDDTGELMDLACVDTGEQLTEKQSAAGKFFNNFVYNAFKEPPSEHVDSGPHVPFIEPYTFTRFYKEINIQTLTAEALVKKRKSFNVDKDFEGQTMKFVGAGLRCMLGESALCHMPQTRVYSFGLYVHDRDRFGFSSADAYEDVILEECPGLIKTIRIFVNVTKTGRHWRTGYRQTLKRRIRRGCLDVYTDPMERADRKALLVQDVHKFSRIFEREGNILAGTEILYTWIDNKFIISIDDEVRCVYTDSDLPRLLFRTYLAKDSINGKVSKFIRKNWYRDFDIDTDPHQIALRTRNGDEQIEHQVRCVMKGNNHDVFTTNNIKSQNRENLSGGGHLWSRHTYEDESLDDEGLYDGDDLEEEEVTYFRHTPMWAR